MLCEWCRDEEAMFERTVVETKRNTPGNVKKPVVIKVCRGCSGIIDRNKSDKPMRLREWVQRG